MQSMTFLDKSEYDVAGTDCARKREDNHPRLYCNRAVCYCSSLKSIWTLFKENWK